MKKTKKILPLVLVLAAVLLTLISCKGDALVADKGQAQIFIEKYDGSFVSYTVDLSSLEDRSEGALSVIKYLKESMSLECVIEDAGYGAYITGIDEISENSSAGEYIIIYTTEEADFAVPTADDPTVPTLKLGDITLVSSGLGLSSMHVGNGTVILFRLESYK